MPIPPPVEDERGGAARRSARSTSRVDQPLGTGLGDGALVRQDDDLGFGRHGSSRAQEVVRAGSGSLSSAGSCHTWVRSDGRRARPVSGDRTEGLGVRLVVVQAAQLLGEQVAELPAGERHRPVRLAGAGQRSPYARRARLMRTVVVADAQVRRR